MSLEVFQTYVAGFTDHLLDQQIIAVQTGYWTAYYVRSKRPKPLKTIVAGLRKAAEQPRISSTGSVAKPEVDVDAFLEREAAFQARLHDTGGGTDTS